MPIISWVLILAGHVLLLLGANVAGETAWTLAEQGRSTDALAHIGRYLVLELGLLSLLWFAVLCAVTA